MDTGGNLSSAKTSKYELLNLIVKLFKTGPSEDVLVDIVISDDLGKHKDKVSIVGRPKLLGSSTKQMRHVTPYFFIEHAIQSTVIAARDKDTAIPYIENIVKLIKPFVKNRQGICLEKKDEDKYQKLLVETFLQEEVDEVLKFTTTTVTGQKNEYYLIYNDKLIEAFEKSSSWDKNFKDKASSMFSEKFEKYIDGGIFSLIERIDPNNKNTITIACELLARMILTMFNQDKYAAFPQEGNSLLEEIRLYDTKEHAQQTSKTPLTTRKEGNWFEVQSHDKIIGKITGKRGEVSKNKKEEYDSRIRIVDNEGNRVKDTADALRILDILVDAKTSDHTDTAKIEQEQGKYNSKYNLQVNMNGLDAGSYNEKISVGNLDNIYHHVAKHLYVVFDFKPLELEVFAPKQKEKKNTIQVYPSATGIKTAEYSVQNGNEYRELQYNSRKGYSDKAVFRSEMTSKEIKEVLCKIIVSHIIISLIPFQSIITGVDLEDDQAQKGMGKVFDSFVDLVQRDYQNAKFKGSDGVEVKLDDNWGSSVYEEYGRQVKPSTSMNVSNISKPEEGNYI
ncbi:MAG: hypothetical protein ACEY3B_05730 [Wolbachia sp.]